MWKEDWFVAQMFEHCKDNVLRGRAGPGAAELVTKGERLLQKGDCERLKQVVFALFDLLPRQQDMLKVLGSANVRAG